MRHPISALRISASTHRAPLLTAQPGRALTGLYLLQNTNSGNRITAAAAAWPSSQKWGSNGTAAKSRQHELMGKTRGSRGGDYEECRLLGYKTPVRTSQQTHYVSATESSQLMLCKIWDFRGGDYEECRLLGYKTQNLPHRGHITPPLQRPAG
jgi:hypothetical protein